MRSIQWKWCQFKTISVTSEVDEKFVILNSTPCIFVILIEFEASFINHTRKKVINRGLNRSGQYHYLEI